MTDTTIPTIPGPCHSCLVEGLATNAHVRHTDGRALCVDCFRFEAGITVEGTSERAAIHGGIVCETIIRVRDLPAGKVVKVSTLKRFSGVSTFAQVLAIQPAGVTGLYTETWTSDDPGATVAVLPRGTRATAKAIRGCHDAGLTQAVPFIAAALATLAAPVEA